MYLKTINVGVIGCGAVLESCHLPAVHSLSRVRIKALADVNEKRMERIIEKFNLRDAETYNDYRLLLKNADIDAVWILTPPGLHAQMIVDALDSGKNIFCEKPIATCTSDIELIKAALERNSGRRSLILLPAHNFIFTPCFEKAMEYIHGGLIGNLVEVYGRAVSNLLFYKAVTDFRLRAKGGVIEDQLPHVIYLSQDLCGSIKRIISIGPHLKGRPLTEDVDVEVEFDTGVKGVLSAAWTTGVPSFKFVVKGSLGSAVMDLLRAPFNLTLIKEGERKVIHLGHRFTQYFNILFGKHPSYINEHMHFIDLINGKAAPRVTVESGFELGRSLELIFNALEERSTIIFHSGRVSIVRVDGDIKGSVEHAISLLDGLNIPRDTNVVIKPNVCFWKNTEGMIITDPRLLEAILKLIKKRTDKITVVESDNNSGTAEKRLKRSGVMDVIERCGVDFINLSRDECEEHEVSGVKIHIPRVVLEAGFFINVPKIKTCNIENISISIAMKNMFGVLGDRKKTVFHKNLVDVLLYINKIIRQDLIIVDGIVGMEGLGPVWGKPVNLNLVISGLNPVTVDAVCCRIMDINPFSVNLLWRAYKMGMGEIDVNKIEVHGEKIDDVKRKFSRPIFITDNLIGALRAALKTYIGT
jgi:predicted dehydrogenase/uncharacterized protein (DUF362 family)